MNQKSVHHPKGMATITIAALLVAGLIVVAGVWAFWPSGGSGSGDDASSVEGAQWYRVAERSFPLTVVAMGELQASDQTEVVSEVEGRVAIVEIVEEGTFVERGDVLVVLESSQIAEKVEQERLSVEQALIDMTSAEQELEIERNESASNIRDAEVKLELAELDLAKWEAGEVLQKRRELKLALEKAERRVTRAKEDLEDSRMLYEEKFISYSELDGNIVEEIEAEAALETAKLDIEVYETYSFTRDKTQKETAVIQARESLELTKRNAERSISRDQATLVSRQRRHRMRSERLSELETQLAATTITAPEAGLVVYSTSIGPRWRRDNPIREGREVHQRETILLLPDTRSMVASVKVHEAELSKIQPGQSATITINATEGDAPLQGEVLTVAVMAEDSGWLNPNLREYRVRIELPADKAVDLKPGMRASAEIEVGYVEDALAVPLHAVHTEGEERFVYVGEGRMVRRQPVQIGEASETYVEIDEGLAADDRVLLRQPEPGEIIQG
ncbi:MAG: efflux RND transporter periplasmic adaptor subunit [Planctomycetota bacterium]